MVGGDVDGGESGKHMVRAVKRMKTRSGGTTTQLSEGKHITARVQPCALRLMCEPTRFEHSPAQQ